MLLKIRPGKHFLVFQNFCQNSVFSIIKLNLKFTFIDLLYKSVDYMQRTFVVNGLKVNLFCLKLNKMVFYSNYHFFYHKFFWSHPADNYMFEVNNRNTITRCEIGSKVTIKTPERRQISSKLIIKTPERCQCRRSNVFIVTFEHISLLVLVFLFLTSSR